MKPLFCQLYKVDEESRTIFARAAQECVDRDGEIFDYKSSVPHFQRWSADCSEGSGGKSLGNVRSMHGNVAAGKLTDIRFDDVEKAIDVTAKIVDDGEWEKILQGVHTGLSIGGRYARKWADVQDGKMVTRYEAVPSEISLVDRPCIPSARIFEVHKRDGRIEKRTFANAPYGVDASSVAAIRKVLARGPTAPETLLKTQRRNPHGRTDVLAGQARRFARTLADGLAKHGLKPIAGLEALAGGVGADSVAAIRKAHETGPITGFPPQSSNAQSGGSIANTGATNNFRDLAVAGGDPATIARNPPKSVAGSPASDSAVAAIKAAHAAGPKRGL